MQCGKSSSLDFNFSEINQPTLSLSFEEKTHKDKKTLRWNLLLLKITKCLAQRAAIKFHNKNIRPSPDAQSSQNLVGINYSFAN